MKENGSRNNYDSEQKTSRRGAAARRKKKAKNFSRAAIISISVICAVILGALAFSLAGFFGEASDVACDGLRIGSHDVSAMTKDEIVSYLSGIENPYASTSITIKMDNSNNEVKINAQDISLTVDSEKTADVAVAYGKKNAFSQLFAKLSKKDVGYVYSYDHLKLESILNSFAKEVGGTLLQHEINILEEEIVIHAGKEGTGVDTAALRKKVLAALKPSSQETITVSKVNTSPADIDVKELYEMTKRETKDAHYIIENNEIIIEDEINGRYFDIDSAKSALKGFGPGSADVSIPFVIQEASIKAQTLNQTLLSDELASYSTKYMTSNVPRSNNVELAAKYINGKILLPGDEFSYNGTVGKRTYERGFKAASVYENNKMVDGLGGGICQTSSTLYAAVLYADLEVVERHEHSLEVTYAPLGMDATVAYGSLDFRFKNNTNAPLKIVATAGRGVVTVKLLGTKENKNKTVKINTTTVSTTPYGVTEIKDDTLPVGETVIDAPGFKGHVVNTYKVIYENGVEIENKFLHKSTYTMVNKVVRVGTNENAETGAVVEPGEDAPPTTDDPAQQSPAPSSSPIPTPSIPQFPDGL